MLPAQDGADWSMFLPELVGTKRAYELRLPDRSHSPPSTLTVWTAHEHLSLFQSAIPHIFPLSEPGEKTSSGEEGHEQEYQAFTVAVIRSWMEIIGPITERELSEKLGLSPASTHQALTHLEREGQVLQGTFRPDIPPMTKEWCHRRLLARIHRLTMSSLRREIEAVSASDFMRFLFCWQHVAPSSRLHGEKGLLEIIQQLSGFEASASAWEPFLLKSRLANYSADQLDYLCLRGTANWGRLTPPINSTQESRLLRKHRIIPTSLAPISLFPRDDANWLLTLSRGGILKDQAWLPEKVSAVAQSVFHYLSQQGASFFSDIIRGTNHLQSEVEQALWELASIGLVTADGFDNLRALLDPKRRRGIGRHQEKRPRHTVGRWCRLPQPHSDPELHDQSKGNSVEAWARQLLKRYGIVFRDMLKRESLPVAWRDLLVLYRQLELRGEIRGGRFVAGFTGEQFALPEAVEALRAVRKDPLAGADRIQLSGSDPLNLIGIIVPGDRVPAIPSQRVMFEEGIPVLNPEASRALA